MEPCTIGMSQSQPWQRSRFSRLMTWQFSGACGVISFDGGFPISEPHKSITRFRELHGRYFDAGAHSTFPITCHPLHGWLPLWDSYCALSHVLWLVTSHFPFLFSTSFMWCGHGSWYYFLLHFVGLGRLKGSVMWAGKKRRTACRTFGWHVVNFFSVFLRICRG